MLSRFLGAGAPSVPTLLQRLNSSTVAKDRRDAAAELSSVPDLWTKVEPNDVAMMVGVLRLTMDDSELADKLTEVLSMVTDDSNVKDESLRHAFCKEVMDVDVLLGLLKCPTFWTRYNAVQLLTRLLDYDSNGLQKQILASHGISALVEVLNDNSNHGVLRNEALMLIDQLTATNTEIQTIVAFENVFDTLFKIVVEEDGINGDIVVEDCLRVTHNMIRSNKATQKLFREMGCFRHLAPLLADFDKEETPTARMNAIMRGTMTIIQRLLRAADSNNEAQVVRSALCQNKVLIGLSLLAIHNNVETPTSIDALRSVALLVSNYKAGADALLGTVCKVQGGSSVGAVWGILRTCLCDADHTKQTSAMGAIAGLLQACGEPAALYIVKNLSSKPGSSQGIHCGYLLGASLFSPSPPTPLTWYNAAWIAHQCVRHEHVAEQLLAIPWEQGMSFYTAYIKHAIAALQSKSVDLPTVCALLRPLYTWFRTSEKAVSIFLNDSSFLLFFIEFATQTRDSAHTKFLCAALIAMLAIQCPAQPPQPTRVTKKQLIETMTKKIGVHNFGDMLGKIRASDEWQQAPANSALSSQAVPYDASYIKMLEMINDDVQQVALSHITGDASPGAGTEERDSANLEPFRQLIRQQDASIQKLKEELKQATERDEVKDLRTLVAKQNKDLQEANNRIMAMSAEAQRSEEERRNYADALAIKEGEAAAVADTLAALEERVATTGDSSTHSSLIDALSAANAERDEMYILLAELEEEMLEAQREAAAAKAAAAAIATSPAPAPVEKVATPKQAVSSPPRSPAVVKPSPQRPEDVIAAAKATADGSDGSPQKESH